jgi:crossover junction endodeoxyribonuclease RusA
MTTGTGTDLDVFVPGRPAPQGSIRAIVHRSTGRAVAIKDNNTTQKAWRQDVAWMARQAWGPQPPIVGPVRIRIDFVMPRPLSTPKRRTPPAIKKPDGDKLERAIWDSLTHVVWVDDAQVVDWAGTKRLAEIGETPGARIRVTAIEEGP